MSELNKYSIKQLEEELHKRKGPPEPLELEEVVLTKLRAQAKDYLYYLYENNRESKDARHYMFEEVMKTLYGPDIFYWINEILNRPQG